MTDASEVRLTIAPAPVIPAPPQAAQAAAPTRADAPSDANTRAGRLRVDFQLVAFWGLAGIVAIAAGVAIGAPHAVGPVGMTLLISVAAAGLVFLYWLLGMKGRMLGMFPSRGQAEDATAAMNRLDSAILDSLPEAALMTDRLGSPVAANGAYRLIASAAGQLGESTRAPSVDRLFGANPGLSSPMYRLAKAAKERRPHKEDLPASQMRPGGPLVHFEASVTPVGQNRTLWRLVERETRLDEQAADPRRMYLEEAPAGFFASRPDGRIVYANASLKSWIGFEGEESKLKLRDFIKEDAGRVLRRDRKGATVRVDATLRRADGCEEPIIVLTSWPAADDGEPVARSLVFLTADAPVSRAPIVDPRSGRVANPLFDAAPFGAAYLDGTDPAVARIEDSNAALMEMTHGAAAPGRSFADLFTCEDGPDLLVETLRKGLNGAVELHVAGDEPPRPGEIARSAHVYVAPTRDGRAIAYVIDLTEVKQLEMRLAQSEKVQAIGQLAAGVAHDFNNLLTGITLNTDKLLSRHTLGDPSYVELTQISQTSARAAELVRMLLAYSRQQTYRREALDITDVLSDFSVLLRQVLDERVTLDVQYGRDVPNIRWDKNQLETVVMNLVTNARDAMSAIGGGAIAIRTQRVNEEHGHNLGFPHLEAGEYALIEVSDTGAGIPEELQEKIFQPFFTTKEAGKGTGLGLATVYGMVKQAGGYIYVKSVVGKGARFYVYLPAFELEGAGVEETPSLLTSGVREPDVHRPEDLSGSGRILLVEDEDVVRGIAAQLLSSNGYRVMAAGDAEEALDMLKEEGGVDLLISDVVLPGMDGPALLAAAKPYLKGAKVIFISGYAERDFARTLDEETEVAFLPKPFTHKQLAELVKRVLSDRRDLAA
jgi:two-component system cell cycle sensor histidine kinase/response regulator CckA